VLVTIDRSTPGPCANRERTYISRQAEHLRIKSTNTRAGAQVVIEQGTLRPETGR